MVAKTGRLAYLNVKQVFPTAESPITIILNVLGFTGCETATGVGLSSGGNSLNICTHFFLMVRRDLKFLLRLSEPITLRDSALSPREEPVSTRFHHYQPIILLIAGSEDAPSYQAR